MTAGTRFSSRRVVEKIVELYDREDSLAVSLLANWFVQMAVHKRIPREDRTLLEREVRSKKELTTIRGRAQEKQRVARAMAAAGYPLTAIALVLDLSVESVELLLANDADRPGASLRRTTLSPRQTAKLHFQEVLQFSGRL